MTRTGTVRSNSSCRTRSTRAIVRATIAARSVSFTPSLASMASDSLSQ